MTSDIRVRTSDDVDQQIKSGLSDFFSAAMGGSNVKKSLIEGAQSLLSATITAVMGESEGTASERRSFVVRC